MKDFIRPRGRLRSLPLAARVVYSVFALFTLIALGLSAWLGADMLGVDLGSLDSYYAGGPSATAVTESAPSDEASGPLLDLPPEADAPVVAEAMPLRKLLEVTHFHLFSMPVYLLILSHLFMLSRTRERAKLFWIALGTLAVAAHMAAPWIARAALAGARAFYAVSGAGMTLALLVMTLVPLWEMWSAMPSSERNVQSE